ncbi:Thiamin-phosphate pyrophosphorylase [hydrothermal vent metagenome]|uniref:Thiamin-phosphate pyrophosphorylase n=1 Tax=hydrothermal vent metagenome TaxID=652676 RepID=A0A1W1CW45_9ZZZZ
MIKNYLITSKPSFIQLKKHLPAFALYRDKETSQYSFHAQNFVQMCKSIPNLKAFLHQDYKLAHALNASGVHLTSLQFDEIKNAKDLALEVIISCHTKEEVDKAEELGADYVTYSPIFETPNKGEPKGVEDLKELVDSTSLKVFALGGIITKEQVLEVQESGAYGFASIRYFG